MSMWTSSTGGRIVPLVIILPILEFLVRCISLRFEVRRRSLLCGSPLGSLGQRSLWCSLADVGIVGRERGATVDPGVLPGAFVVFFVLFCFCRCLVWGRADLFFGESRQTTFGQGSGVRVFYFRFPLPLFISNTAFGCLMSLYV